MGLIREPKEVDMSMQSKPWTEKELSDFRKLMQEIKLKNAKRKNRVLRSQSKQKQPP